MAQTFIDRFLRDEDGAVTVDWVVLTAGILGFGVLMASFIIDASTSTSNSVGASLSDATVPSIDFNGP